MVIDEQKYRSIARELRKEKKLLAQLMTHCHTRYAYAPVYDAMEKGANAIEEFVRQTAVPDSKSRSGLRWMVRKTAGNSMSNPTTSYRRKAFPNAYCSFTNWAKASICERGMDC